MSKRLCTFTKSIMTKQKTNKMKNKELYIADGRKFSSMEAVEAYAKDRGLRVVNTETIRKNTFLIDLKS